MDILETKPKRKKTREASFWQSLKKAIRDNFPEWSATRLESRATLGVPDVLAIKLTSATGHEVFLYRGDQAVDVKLEGLRTRPAKHFSNPVNYRDVLETIARGSNNL